MNFGNKLRVLIDEQDVTQKELANKLNISPSTLGNYIQNTREPDFETLKCFADYFSVSIDYLLSYQSDTTTNHSEDEILRIFRSLTSQQQEIYLEQGKAFIKHNHKKAVGSE